MMSSLSLRRLCDWEFHDEIFWKLKKNYRKNSYICNAVRGAGHLRLG